MPLNKETLNSATNDLNKDDFDIKQPTKVDMPLNKEAKTKIYIYIYIYIHTHTET